MSMRAGKSAGTINTATIVTRLPGTFGKAYEAIGSTVSSADPAAGPLAAHSGSTSVETACIVSGNIVRHVFPIMNAQARPARTAI